FPMQSIGKVERLKSTSCPVQVHRLTQESRPAPAGEQLFQPPGASNDPCRSARRARCRRQRAPSDGPCKNATVGREFFCWSCFPLKSLCPRAQLQNSKSCAFTD